MSVDNKFDPVLISMVRKTAPSLIASEIVGVQPMNPDIFNDLCKVAISYKSEEEWNRYNWFGDLIHSFIYGYQAWDGEEFINLDEFIHLYGKSRVINYRWKD